MQKIRVKTKTGGYRFIKTYECYEFINEVDIAPLIADSFRVNNKGVNVYNKPITFDIETSYKDYGTAEQPDRFTFMYIWQVCIEGIVVIGRYWDEWLDLLRYLYDSLEVSSESPVFIFVHNLAYEFGFIKGRLPIKDTFARQNHHPLSVKLGGDFDGLEFRCSYSVSNNSLSNVAKDTLLCPFFKQPDFDYGKLRLPTEPLTATELRYCVVDPVIVYYYILDVMNDFPFVSSIPMTATGIVRRAAYKAFGNVPYWRKFFYKTRLTTEQYKVYRAAFAGGDTHLSPQYYNRPVKVRSFDLTSSYPSRWTEEFPLSTPISINKPIVDDIKTLIKYGYLFVADIVIGDVKLKSIYSFDVIPKAHCISVSNPKCENGRIVSADILRICRTSVDWRIISDNYDFKVLKCERLVYHEKKGLLPKCFRDFVFKYYRNKTELKGVDGMEREYMVNGKIPLNSIYGMTVTNIVAPKLQYNSLLKEWVELPQDLDDAIDAFYASRSSFLPYHIGVWVTAYSRYDLHRGLNKCGQDAVYWDTDSIKFTGDHLADFEQLNADKMERLSNFYIEDIAPKNKNGERSYIGLWDAEHNGDPFLFKSYGSKKYFCKFENGKSNLTVAGLNKKTALSYLEENGIDIFDIELGHTIPEFYSGRTYSEVVNTPRVEVINGVRIEEKTYINIFNTSYTFGDTREHILYCAWVNKEISRRYDE